MTAREAFRRTESIHYLTERFQRQVDMLALTGVFMHLDKLPLDELKRRAQLCAIPKND